MRLTVYRISSDGQRQDVAEETFDGEPDSYAPRYPAWPACACPRHRA